jgi:hypothetical protein
MLPLGLTSSSSISVMVTFSFRLRFSSEAETDATRSSNPIKQLSIFSQTSDLIVTQERGKSVARCLGQHSSLLLRNHGIVTAGRSIEEAAWIALKLEGACWVQLMAEWAGGPKFVARRRGPPGQEQAQPQAGPLHQRVQLSGALLVPPARQGRRIPAVPSTTRPI